MNVLIFSWRGPKHPHEGGAEYSSHEHAKGWVKAGHSVTLFTSSFKGAKNEEYIDGVQIIRRGNQIFGVHLQAVIWYLFSSHFKFDMVIDEIHGIPFFTPLFVRTKKLGFIHEVAKEVWILNPWPKPLNMIPAIIGTIAEPLIFKFIYSNISFMTVSESTKYDLIHWGISRENISVIHNGFRKKPYIKKVDKERKKTIIYLGALSKDKGAENALEVFSLLLKEEGDWQFWVVGKAADSYLRFIRQKSEKLGINKVVKFFGFVSEQEKYNLLSKAHVLINPSFREGWGLVVIEAASVGTPTVAYNVSGLRDSVADNKTGLLCEPNPKSCAEKIAYLMKNQQLYTKLKKNCLKWSNKFSWEKSCQKSLTLIEKLADI